MIMTRDFRDQLPVAIMFLLLATIGLVALSAPRTEPQHIAAISLDSLSEMGSE